MSKDTSLLKAGSLLFTGSMVANFINYLFQIVMARLLSIEDYGAMNSLFSLFTITTMPSITITMVIAKYISSFKVKEQMENITNIFYSFLKKIFLSSSLGFLAFLILSPYISSYLKIALSPTVILGISLFIGFLNPINIGVLQGLQRFKFLSFSFGFGSFLKLICAAILVYFGLGINGVMTAIAIAGFSIFYLTFLYLRSKKYILPMSKAQVLKKEDWRDILKYSLPVFFSTVIFSILTQVDMVLVKHYFPANEAGLYASAAVLGRTVLYLPAAIVIALFPMVAGLHSLNKDTFRILNRAIAYTGLLAGVAVILFWLMPEFLLGTLFGQRFSPAAPLLGIFALAMLPLAILGLLMSFNLARYKVNFIYSLFFGAILEIGLLHFYHNSLSQVLWIVAGGGTVLLACNLAFIFHEKNLRPQSIEGAAVLMEGKCQ